MFYAPFSLFALLLNSLIVETIEKSADRKKLCHSLKDYFPPTTSLNSK